MHMHDLVDDLEQRLVVVNLAVMHVLWLAPAAIKQNLGRTIRAIGGEVCSIMMPASVLMAVLLSSISL